MIKLLTHDDLDGIACGILGKYYLGDCIDVEYCSNNNINQAFEVALNGEYEQIWITDLSISKENADKVINQNIPVVLLDHHKSALWLNDYQFAEVQVMNGFDEPTSGAELFYFFLSDRCLSGVRQFSRICSKMSILLPIFVEKIRRYDTYEWVTLEDKEAKQLNDLLGIYGRDKFIEVTLAKLRNPKMELFTSFEKRLLEIRQNEIQRTIDYKANTMVRTKFEGYNVGVVFADKFTSEIGNALCNRNKDLDFVMMISYNDIGLRGKDKVDLSELAKKYGGGGHFNAAGFPINGKENINMILESINEKL